MMRGRKSVCDERMYEVNITTIPSLTSKQSLQFGDLRGLFPTLLIGHTLLIPVLHGHGHLVLILNRVVCRFFIVFHYGLPFLVIFGLLAALKQLCATCVHKNIGHAD